MAGYIRQSLSQIQDGQIVNAAPINAEYNTLEAAFSSVSGHKHDGTPSEGAPITTIGPTQNVNATSTELYPRVDNFVSLGTSALQFKDLFVKGASSLRNTTVTGTFNVTGATTLTGALTATTSLTVPVVNATTSLTTPVVNATTSVTTPTVIANISSQGYVFTGLGSGFRSPSTGTVEVYAASGNKVAVGSTGITVTGNLAAQNTLSVAGTSSLTGNTSLGGSLTVTGASALNGGATTTTLNTTGNVSVGGTLNVVGNTTLSSVAASSLSVSGATLLSSGTASAPSLSFTGDTDTGVYRTGTDGVGIATGGSSRLGVTSTAVSPTVPLRTTDGSLSAPGISFTNDPDTGIVGGGGSGMGFTVGGQLIADVSSSGVAIPNGKFFDLGVGSLFRLNGSPNANMPPVVGAEASSTATQMIVNVPQETPSMFWVWPTISNTGGITIRVNGAAAETVRTPSDTALPAGYLTYSSGPPLPILMIKGATNWTAWRMFPERVTIPNGYYLKSPDGSMSYVQELNSTEGITTASAGLFVTSANQTWDFDVTFSAVNFCSMSFLRGDRDGGVSLKQRGSSSVIYRPWCMASLPAGNNYILQLRVDGRWF